MAEPERYRGGPKPSAKVCETCGRYSPILDTCAVNLSVRSEETRRKGCPEWERDK